jgi:anti-sigma factor RsiW
VFAGKRHLGESALIRRYLADRGLGVLETKDEALMRHLAHCSACAARYASLQSALDDTRQAASDEAAAVCTPARMERQRERILRQIDGLSGGSRVLPFPAAGQGAHAAHEHRVMGRWVAAAAIAGLMVGLTAGQLLDRGGWPGRGAQPQVAASTAPAAPRGVPTLSAINVEPAVNEDQFLSEVELATAAPRTPELRAIYAFTLEAPHDPSRAGKD